MLVRARLHVALSVQIGRGSARKKEDIMPCFEVGLKPPGHQMMMILLPLTITTKLGNKNLLNVSLTVISRTSHGCAKKGQVFLGVPSWLNLLSV